MFTLTDLEDNINDAKEFVSLYIAVAIRAPGLIDPEIIINSTANADTKLEYYKRAYNSDLTLKTFEDIQIVDFTYGNTFKEIEEYLLKGNRSIT